MARMVVGAGACWRQYAAILSSQTAVAAYSVAEFDLSTDLHAACIGARQANDGAVIIAGTGSCGLADVQKGKCWKLAGTAFHMAITAVVLGLAISWSIMCCCTKTN
ncbi:MAG: hypothetical protein U5L01_11115 [Rheinheimera sp.]|nr:hypothetical protein [Rheinheimera sp.]